jgi:hypothetical protein
MVKTFSGMGKILTSRHNHLFEILIVQLFADFFHQKVSGFDNLSTINVSGLTFTTCSWRFNNSCSTKLGNNWELSSSKSF